MKMSIGLRIKTRRAELGLSQRALAKKCQISGSSVALWESDQTEPSGKNLMQAAKALETTPEWITTGETKISHQASDRRFSKFIDDNMKFLNEDQRKDIEKLIEHAREREEILKKYE